jgi:hypothetical protein
MDQSGKAIDERRIYQIRIEGKLNDKWALWLDGTNIKIQESSNITTILITVPDQSALRGILNKLWDLNLVIISIQLVDLEQSLNVEEGGFYQ